MGVIDYSMSVFSLTMYMLTLLPTSNASLVKNIPAVVSNYTTIELAKSNSDVLNDNLANQVTNLEKEMAALKMGFQIQDRKYSALLSAFLKQLSTARENLEIYRQENLNLQSELYSVKAQITSSSVNLNNSELALNATRESVKDIESDVESLKTDMENIRASVMIQNQDHNLTATAVSVMRDDVDAINSTLIARIEMMSNSITVNTEPQNVTKDVGGILTNRDNSVAFEAVRFHRQRDSNVTTAGSTLPFDRVLINAGGGFNSTLGKYIVPVSGTYILWVNCVFSSNAFNIHLMIHGHSQSETKIIGFINGITTSLEKMHRILIANAVRVVHVDAGTRIWVTATDDIRFESFTSGFGGALIREDV